MILAPAPTFSLNIERSIVAEVDVPGEPLKTSKPLPLLRPMVESSTVSAPFAVFTIGRANCEPPLRTSTKASVEAPAVVPNWIPHHCPGAESALEVKTIRSEPVPTADKEPLTSKDTNDPLAFTTTPAWTSQRHTRIHSHCPRHHIGAIRQRPSRVARNRARDVRRPCTQRRAGHDHDTGQKQKQEPGSQPLAQVTPQHTYLRTHRIVPADRTVKPTGASSTADARASNVKSATRRAQQTPREPAQTARNPMKNNLPLAVPKPRHTASPQSQDHDSPTTNQESSMVRYRHPPIEGYPSDAPRSRATQVLLMLC